jgi:hypothetical protein
MLGLETTAASTGAGATMAREDGGGDKSAAGGALRTWSRRK